VTHFLDFYGGIGGLFGRIFEYVIYIYTYVCMYV
jgi:hypothetical protein